MYKPNSSASADTTAYADVLLTVALALAERGYYVFPVLLTQDPDDPYRKQSDPLVKWTTESTRDLEVIRGWFGKGGQFRGTGLAIDCGRSGIAVVDLDVKPGKNGVAEWKLLVVQYGEEGTPLRATTWTGGKHLIYRARPEASIGNTSRGEVARGIDTRDVGGCIFVAPTVVQESGGKSYQFDGLASIEGLPHVEELPFVPAWLPPLAKKKPAKPTTTRATTAVPRQRRASQSTGWDRVEESQYLHATLRGCLDTPAGLLRSIEAAAREIEAIPQGESANDPCFRTATGFVPFILAGEVPEEVVRARLHAAVDTWRDGHDQGRTGIDSGLTRYADTAEPRKWIDEDTFWTARPTLTHLRDAAYSELASPKAVLNVAIAHTLARVPPAVVLPTFSNHRGAGAGAPLNHYAAIVGASGKGKGEAERVARQALAYVGGLPYIERVLATGQGLVAEYVGAQKRRRGDEGSAERLTDTVMFSLDEVDQLTSYAAMKGSNVLSTLTSAWSGKSLGGSTAAEERNRRLEENSYRACLVVGVQPEQAGVLVGKAGRGVPQRVCWAPARAPEITEMDDDDLPAWPGVREVILPQSIRQMMMPTADAMFSDDVLMGDDQGVPRVGWWAPAECLVMEVCETARYEVRKARRQQHATEETSLDSHALLVQLRVAACLAIWDGRLDVNDDDWRLSRVVMGWSREARDACLQGVQGAARDAYRNKYVAERDAQTAADEKDLADTIEAIVRSLRKRTGEWVTKGRVTPDVTKRLRDAWFEEAVDRLVTEKRVEKRDSARGYRLRLTSW